MNIKHDEFKKRLRSEKEFITVIEHERQRANRNKHYFSLIILELELEEFNKEKVLSFINRMTKRIRIIDEIGWHGANRVGVILPYTNSRGARDFLESLGDLIDSLVPGTICTICTYPPGCEVNNQTKPIFGGR